MSLLGLNCPMGMPSVLCFASTLRTVSSFSGVFLLSAFDLNCLMDGVIGLNCPMGMPSLLCFASTLRTVSC